MYRFSENLYQGSRGARHRKSLDIAAIKLLYILYLITIHYLLLDIIKIQGLLGLILELSTKYCRHNSGAQLISYICALERILFY